MRLGALEAGGTKMVCAVGDETGAIFDKISIPTQTPADSMPKMIRYFKENKIEALGIGSFGPIDLRKDSPTYGYITSTPKRPWMNYDFVGGFAKELHCPIGFDTDTNAAALGEASFGATKGLNCSMYITVGTGIGVGIFVENQLLHGMLHPEAGHILMAKHPNDTYAGKCPFHGTCFEGLAAGPAIEERFGAKADTLAEREDVWEMEAYYIAQALMNYTLTVSPKRIVLGGGVMHQKQLFPLVRKKFKELLNGYLRTEELEDLEQFIVPSKLNDNQGIMGCLKLAEQSLKEEPGPQLI